MEPIVRLERDCADVWPAQVNEPLGEWRMRAAGGFTTRANSTLTTGNPGMPIADALAATVEFAGRHGIGACAHVVLGSPAEAGVEAAGWHVDVDRPNGAECLVLTGPLSPGDFTGAVVNATPSPEWWELTAGSPNPSDAQRHVLSSYPGIGYGVVSYDGAVVGAVRGAVIGDLLHVSRLAVRPSHRRLGLANGLLRALYAWAVERGAQRQALQVTTGNTAAIDLYKRLGCAEHHGYRYWVPAA